MFVTNYCQSNVIARRCNLTPKHSFCNTVCVCMVMQIKLVVVVGRTVAGEEGNIFSLPKLLLKK